MTSVWNRSHPRQERFSVTPLSITPSFVAFLDSSPLLESKFSEQPDGLLVAKLPIPIIPTTAIDILKYFKDNLQWILKTILEVQTPISTPVLVIAPAPATSEVPRDKLKARSPDVYYGKSYMNCYNF